jgi:hypothetical protein
MIGVIVSSWPVSGMFNGSPLLHAALGVQRSTLRKYQVASILPAAGRQVARGTKHSRNTIEINRAHRGLPTVGRRAGTLGEIVNPAVSSTYFTCLRQAGEAKRSLFLLYFNRIYTWYFVPGTLYYFFNTFSTPLLISPVSPTFSVQ